MTPRSLAKSIDVSEECTAPIFLIEEKQKKFTKRRKAICGFLDLIVNPENGGGTFLGNSYGLLSDYRALHFTRHLRENLKSNMKTFDDQILQGCIKSLI